VDDPKYWVGFNRISGIGPMRFKKLLDFFGTMEAAWRAGPGELYQAGLETRSVENILASRPAIALDREMDRLRRLDAHVLTWQSPDYPRLLRNIYDAPPVLYLKGSLLPQDDLAIAVVGTRKATVYGREVTARLVSELARHQITVVSGLARGIDSVAHRAALDAGGRTIAVLGHGIDTIYPAQNLGLARDIVSWGALLTDYPLGMPPEAGNFPPRNRIISGLSLGVLVTEAGDKSGALITVDNALEQGREVFAVPGNMLSGASRGTNRLLQQGGAKLVLEVKDILEELNLTMISQQLETRAILPENDTEAVLLQHLSGEPVHIDEISRECGLPIAAVSSALAMMELKGMVRQVGGMNYVVARIEAGSR
jgi:DNA processing protein